MRMTLLSGRLTTTGVKPSLLFWHQLVPPVPPVQSCRRFCDHRLLLSSNHFLVTWSPVSCEQKASVINLWHHQPVSLSPLPGASCSLTLFLLLVHRPVWVIDTKHRLPVNIWKLTFVLFLSVRSSDTVPLPFLQIIVVHLPFYVKPRV